jgi:hypothetical protein
MMRIGGGYASQRLVERHVSLLLELGFSFFDVRWTMERYPGINSVFNVGNIGVCTRLIQSDRNCLMRTKQLSSFLGRPSEQ